MGTRRAFVAIVLLIAGCGGGSDLGRIKPGMSATVHGVDGKSATVFFSGKTESLSDGTVVHVIADSEGADSEPHRKVVVGIQDGPSQGLAAQMYRSDLRPAD